MVNKKEVAEAEVKKWETMYNEWMSKMEERVGNINRTQNLLQVLDNLWFLILTTKESLNYSNFCVSCLLSQNQKISSEI